MKKTDEKVMGIVKVGPKGQIVIPKEMRDLFGIEQGESLLMLADKERGMVLHKLSYFTAVTEEMIARGAGASEKTFLMDIRKAEEEEGK